MTGYLEETKGDASFARSGWLAIIRACDMSIPKEPASHQTVPYLLILWKRKIFAKILERTRSNDGVNPWCAIFGRDWDKPWCREQCSAGHLDACLDGTADLNEHRRREGLMVMEQ
jgi:hypothetical protein